MSSPKRRIETDVSWTVFPGYLREEMKADVGIWLLGHEVIAFFQ